MAREWGRWLLLAVVALAGCRGALGATYTSASTTFSWIDSSTHTKVGYNTSPYKFNASSGCGTTPPVLDDTLSDAIPIGFTFTYGVTGYTSLYIMTNGRVQFGNTTCGYGTQSVGPPQTYPYGYPIASMNNTMKVFGVDLDPTNLVDKPNYPSAGSKTNCTSSATCYISYASLGTAPNRKFVITWKSVPEWVSSSNTSGSFDLQVILNEDGTFIYQYGTITHGGTGTAQIGWQLSTTDYAVLSFGASTEPPASTAIIFYIPSASPIAEYRFEDGAWNSGAAGQVTDASSGGRNGTALGSAQEIAAGYVCRGASIPANTTAGAVDGVKTGLRFSDSGVNMLGQGTAMFWYKDNAAWNSGTAAQLLDATSVSGQWFSLTKTGTGTLYFQVTDSTGAVWSVETAAQTFAAGTWVNVAISWNFNANPGSNQDHLSVFINGGSPTTAAFTSSGTVTTSVDYLTIGDNPSGYTGTKGTVNSANGTVDELRIYNFELNQGQVAAASATTHSCSTYVIDHFELRHGTWSGLACAPGTLSVVACGNAACSTLYTQGVIATLSASGSATVWDASSGGATVIIGNTTSSASKDFYTAPGTATFDIAGTGVPVSPTSAKKCNGVSGSCVWTSTNGGLVLTVPSSGVIIGGQETAVSVQAVQASGPTPGAPCIPVKGLTGAGLKVWTTASSPAAFAGTSTSAGVTVGGAPQAANASAGSYLYTPQTKPASDNLTGFAFDSSTATTSLWIKDMDTGSWALNVQLDTAASSLAPALSLTGNAAVTSIPVGYGVKATAVTASGATQTACAGGTSAACDAAAGADAKVGQAGTAFSATVTAALWTGSGDTDLSDNPVAPSYAGAVALAPALAAPSGGTGGSLGVTSVTLVGGTATTAAQTWSQAGALRIYGSATYLGQSVVPASTIQNPVLGRFVSHHFAMAPTAACGSFTYSGQAFTAVTITAMTPASVQDGNYAGAFARQVTLSDASGSSAGSFGATGTVLATAFIAGQATATPTYTFGGTPPVKTLPLTTLQIRATDTDGVVSSGEGNSVIRSGRLWLANAYGNEFLALKVPAQSQYWNGGWQQNQADNCTQLTVPTSSNGGLKFYAPPDTARNALAAGETTATLGGSPAGKLVNGDAKLTLSAPGAGNYGYVDVIASKLGSPAWLPPSGDARACFGTCGPRSPIIHSRENY